MRTFLGFLMVLVVSVREGERNCGLVVDFNGVVCPGPDIFDPPCFKLWRGEKPCAPGDDEMTINGHLEDNVLLPCPCPDSDFDNFKWQIEEQSLVYRGNPGTFFGRYINRARVFLADNSGNCSVLLINITMDDQGKYTCIFKIKGLYNRLVINLKVSGKPWNMQQDTVMNCSQSACFMRYVKIILAVAVLGFYLM